VGHEHDIADRLRRQEYSQHLEDLIKNEKLASADGGTPEQWANESLRLAGMAWVQELAQSGAMFQLHAAAPRITICLGDCHAMGAGVQAKSEALII
jgi:hypothetical protein